MQKHARFLLVLTLTLSAALHAIGQADQLALSLSKEKPSQAEQLAQSLSKGSPSQAERSRSLTKGDSLFAARQYTQAFDIYESLHQQGTWSPAMFLRMAYIEEGLGRLGASLYYLNLYAHTSHDPQAAEKMKEMAEKHGLEGYEDDPYETLRAPLRQFYLPLAGLLAAVSLLFLALIFRRFRLLKTPSPALAVFLVLSLAALYGHIHYSPASRRAIVIGAQTYLMSGPSAGASVVQIIGEGHQLRVEGRADIWLRVKWRDQDVYVRDFLVRKVEL